MIDPTSAATLAACGGYLLGSIPFGLLLTRAAGLGDIRAIGSGNIGATNVLRTGNKAIAAATLLLDGAKGTAAVLIAQAILGPMMAPDAPLFAGLGAVLGHLFPVWLGFRGGKGMATAIGALLGAAWPVGIFACAAWLVIAAVTRRSSLAALLSISLAPAVAWWLSGPWQGGLGILLAILVVIRHHENIRRLLAGEEPRIGRRA